MSKSRIKRIIILLLAFADLTLLGNLIYHRYSAAHIPKTTLDSTVAYLQRCGIWIEESTLPGRSPSLSTMLLAEDERAETAVAEALLGDDHRTDQGGGIAAYESDRGTVTFRRGGLISASLNQIPTPADASAAQKQAEELLRTCRILPDSYGIVVETGGNGMTVRFIQRIGDYPLQNAGLEVTFRDGAAQISGCAFLNEVRGGSERMQQIPALLAEFGAYVVESGSEISLIASVEPVYFHTVASDGGAELLPALLVRTDRGDFVLNGVDATLLAGT